MRALLELLRELLIELGEAVSDPSERQFLETLRITGEAGRTVKELLALEHRPSDIRRNAAARALERRLDRANTWVARPGSSR